jgi:hypothetical protein
MAPCEAQARAAGVSQVKETYYTGKRALLLLTYRAAGVSPHAQYESSTAAGQAARTRPRTGGTAVAPAPEPPSASSPRGGEWVEGWDGGLDGGWKGRREGGREGE